MTGSPEPTVGADDLAVQRRVHGAQPGPDGPWPGPDPARVGRGGRRGTPDSVHAELDLAGRSTPAHARRDRDLRKPHLLDTDRFPTMTFTSTNVEAHGDGWLLPGRLAARGTEIDVVLTTTFVMTARSRHRARPRRRSTGATLGIRAPRLMIGRRIDGRDRRGATPSGPGVATGRPARRRRRSTCAAPAHRAAPRSPRRRRSGPARRR